MKHTKCCYRLIKSPLSSNWFSTTISSIKKKKIDWIGDITTKEFDVQKAIWQGSFPLTCFIYLNINCGRYSLEGFDIRNINGKKSDIYVKYAMILLQPMVVDLLQKVESKKLNFKQTQMTAFAWIDKEPWHIFGI